MISSTYCTVHEFSTFLLHSTVEIVFDDSRGERRQTYWEKKDSDQLQYPRYYHHVTQSAARSTRSRIVMCCTWWRTSLARRKYNRSTKSTHQETRCNPCILYSRVLYCKSNQQTDDDDSIARVRKTKHDVQIVVSIM